MLQPVRDFCGHANEGHLVNTEVAEVAKVAEAMIDIFFSIQQWLYSGVSYYKGRSSRSNNPFLFSFTLGPK